jgi:hypothetical protein
MLLYSNQHHLLHSYLDLRFIIDCDTTCLSLQNFLLKVVIQKKKNDLNLFETCSFLIMTLTNIASSHQPPPCALFRNGPAFSELCFHFTILRKNAEITFSHFRADSLSGTSGSSFRSARRPYFLETYHLYPDCSTNATYYIFLTRFGSDVSYQPYSTVFTYRSCNASHTLEYVHRLLVHSRL